MLESLVKVVPDTIKWIFSSRWLLLTIAFVSAFVLWAPDDWLIALGLDSWSTQYRTAFGLAFLLTVSALIIWILSGSAYFIRDEIVDKRKKDRAIEYLGTLGTPEKIILAQYFVEDSKIIPLNLAATGHAGELERLGIIRRVPIAPGAYLFPNSSFSISHWAYDYLMEKPELLDTPETGNLDNAS